MKKLIALLFLLMFIAYCMIVWGWIQEGNRNFEIQRQKDAQGI